MQSLPSGLIVAPMRTATSVVFIVIHGDYCGGMLAGGHQWIEERQGE